MLLSRPLRALSRASPRRGNVRRPGPRGTAERARRLPPALPPASRGRVPRAYTCRGGSGKPSCSQRGFTWTRCNRSGCRQAEVAGLGPSAVGSGGSPQSASLARASSRSDLVCARAHHGPSPPTWARRTRSETARKGDRRTVARARSSMWSAKKRTLKVQPDQGQDGLRDPVGGVFGGGRRAQRPEAGALPIGSGESQLGPGAYSWWRGRSC